MPRRLSFHRAASSSKFQGLPRFYGAMPVNERALRHFEVFKSPTFDQGLSCLPPCRGGCFVVEGTRSGAESESEGDCVETTISNLLIPSNTLIENTTTYLEFGTRGRLVERQNAQRKAILMLLSQKSLRMVASALHLCLLLVGGQRADDVDASGSEAIKIRILDLSLGHQTSGGADDVVAFAVATADVFGENNFFAEAAGFLAGWAHWDDLETHDDDLPRHLLDGDVEVVHAPEHAPEQNVDDEPRRTSLGRAR